MATIALHKNARTTPAIRREIQQSKLSERALAENLASTGQLVRMLGKGGKRVGKTNPNKAQRTIQGLTLRPGKKGGIIGVQVGLPRFCSPLLALFRR